MKNKLSEIVHLTDNWINDNPKKLTKACIGLGSVSTALCGTATASCIADGNVAVAVGTGLATLCCASIDYLCIKYLKEQNKENNNGK